MVLQGLRVVHESHRRTAREMVRAMWTPQSSGPNNSVPSRGANVPARCGTARAIRPHVRSRVESSASSIFKVMIPSACPVITGGPPGRARSRSKARPCSGSSLTRETTGRPNARSEEISLRLAISMRRQHSAFSGKDKSGRVRFKRQDIHRRSSSPISQLHAAAVSRFWQRRYVLRPAPDPRGSSHVSGAGPCESLNNRPSFGSYPKAAPQPRHTEFGKNTGRPHLQR